MQSPGVVLGKGAPLQQIYRRTPKIKITLQRGYSAVNLQCIFRTPFNKNTSWGVLLNRSNLKNVIDFKMVQEVDIFRFVKYIAIYVA